jgi:bacterioferritin (cytochrome b1)
MKTDCSEIVEDLNRLMAEEVEAFLRYFQMKYRLRGVDRLAAEKLFEEGTRETLEHAEAIAKQIRVLGHIPQLKIDLDLRSGPTNLQDALAEMLEVERQALDAYKEVPVARDRRHHARGFHPQTN